MSLYRYITVLVWYWPLSSPRTTVPPVCFLPRGSMLGSHWKPFRKRGRFLGIFEPPHDKTNNVACAPSEDSDQPGHPPSLIRVSAWRIKKAWVLSYPLRASEDSDQTGRMPRLIWVFAGRTSTLLVLSWGGSYNGCEMRIASRGQLFGITRLADQVTDAERLSRVTQFSVRTKQLLYGLFFLHTLSSTIAFKI